MLGKYNPRLSSQAKVLQVLTKIFKLAPHSILPNSDLIILCTGQFHLAGFWILAIYFNPLHDSAPRGEFRVYDVNSEQILSVHIEQ